MNRFWRQIWICTNDYSFLSKRGGGLVLERELHDSSLPDVLLASDRVHPNVGRLQAQHLVLRERMRAQAGHVAFPQRRGRLAVGRGLLAERRANGASEAVELGDGRGRQ